MQRAKTMDAVDERYTIRGFGNWQSQRRGVEPLTFGTPWMLMLELGYIVCIAAYNNPKVLFRLMQRYFLSRVGFRRPFLGLTSNPYCF